MYRSFCTAVTCMDGRIQLPGIRYLQQHFGVEYVDTITEAGPINILANQTEPKLVQSILNRINTSVNVHNSHGLGVFGHHDCAGNPVPKDEQIKQIKATIHFLKQHYPDLPIIGLWIDEHWKVNLVETEDYA